MSHQQEPLSFGPALIAVTGLFILVAALTGAFHFINQWRAQQVVATYTRETQEYVRQNQTVFTALYKDTFVTCQQALFPENSRTSPGSRQECTAAQETLSQLQNTENLKDFSATLFLRYSDGRFEFLSASGQFTTDTTFSRWYGFSGAGKTLELEEAVRNGKLPKNAWQDFSYELPRKEVLVQVTDQDGAVLGYMLRSVIE